MTTFKPTGANAKIRAVLDLALKRGEIKVNLPTFDEAKKLRALCYSVRQADRKKKRNNGESKYDDISIAVDDTSIILTSATELLEGFDIVCPKTGETILKETREAPAVEETQTKLGVEDDDDNFLEKAIREIEGE